jgi:uncharacterized phage-associated protein
MNHPFEFNLDKGIEAILYIAQKVDDPTFHRISKIMYFADRKHLEKYGRFICGDSYVAMKHGPVPSEIYDILKAVRADTVLSLKPYEAAKKVQSAFSVQEPYEVKHLRESNLDFFSESDLECLNYSIENYRNLSFDELTELSHDQAWEAANENDFIEIEQIARTLNNAEELISHLQDQHPGEAL